jgi:N-acetylmuramoyl-L-alanine amidase
MTETGEFDIVIESNQKTGDVFDEWGGTANISFSNSISRKIKYVDNEPEQISFRGGYIEMVNNNSILSYTAKLPEFDKDNVSTDNIIDYEDSAMIETFPSQRRLLVPDLSHIRGHWAEEDIKIMFSLEVFDMDEEVFNPSKYVTRGEFTKAFINAAKEVPDDPALAKTTRTTNRNTETEEEQESIFPDVSKDNEFYESIESAYNREIIYGRYDGNFYPDDPITVAESVTIFIRTLGLENMAPNPTPVTIFKDHDEIPEYARPYIYVAYTIGLINGDTKGYLKPNDYISYSRFAAMLRRFIGYMNDGIKEDYRENIVNY